MQVNYLAAMGIATWQVCTALPGAKTPQYNSFKLLNPSGSCVGLLLYELSDDISLEVSFQAEQLLKAMLQAIKLQAVPCYLTQQMTISKVLLLGEKIAQYWLNDSLPLTELRLENAKRAEVIVTYHPLDLLRDTGLKRMAWQDLQLFVQ